MKIIVSEAQGEQENLNPPEKETNMSWCECFMLVVWNFETLCHVTQIKFQILSAIGSYFYHLNNIEGFSWVYLYLKDY